MTRPRLPVDPVLASLGRRRGGSGEPASHPVPPLAGSSTDADLPLLIDSREVARLLGIGRTKAFELIARRELPAVRIGRCVRVSRAALSEWVLECGRGTACRSAASNADYDR
jgi:prophage regulatory protein